MQKDLKRTTFGISDADLDELDSADDTKWGQDGFRSTSVNN